VRDFNGIMGLKIKNMKNKTLLVILIAVCLISCKGNLREKAETSGITPVANSDAFYRNGEINYDCNYYINDDTKGHLIDGQTGKLVNW